MPHISPRDRARRFVNWLRHHDVESFDNIEERLAEMIADAQEEVREGFLAKPRGREAKIHD